MDDKKIKSRVSYRLFSELLGFLNEKPGKVEVLRKFYELLDGRQTFGSLRNAEAAKESMEFLITENKLA